MEFLKISFSHSTSSISIENFRWQYCVDIFVTLISSGKCIVKSTEIMRRLALLHWTKASILSGREIPGINSTFPLAVYRLYNGTQVGEVKTNCSGYSLGIGGGGLTNINNENCSNAYWWNCVKGIHINIVIFSKKLQTNIHPVQLRHGKGGGGNVTPPRQHAQMRVLRPCLL